jgi:hypothetical protein
MHWNVVGGLRLRAVMHTAISKTVSGASICTLEFGTVTELSTVVSSLKNIFVESSLLILWWV